MFVVLSMLTSVLINKLLKYLSFLDLNITISYVYPRKIEKVFFTFSSRKNLPTSEMRHFSLNCFKAHLPDRQWKRNSIYFATFDQQITFCFPHFVWKIFVCQKFFEKFSKEVWLIFSHISLNVAESNLQKAEVGILKTS